MLKIGQINTLVIHEVLHEGYTCVANEASINDDEFITYVYLPNADNVLAVGDSVDAFVYIDKQQQCVATTTHPKAVSGSTVLLQATGMTDFGAFFDWGLGQDLLVPTKYLQEVQLPLRFLWSLATLLALCLIIHTVALANY